MMNTLIIDKKKFVVVEERKYQKLELLAAQKEGMAKKLTLIREGKNLAYKLIDSWAKEK